MARHRQGPLHLQHARRSYEPLRRNISLPQGVVPLAGREHLRAPLTGGAGVAAAGGIWQMDICCSPMTYMPLREEPSHAALESTDATGAAATSSVHYREGALLDAVGATETGICLWCCAWRRRQGGGRRDGLIRKTLCRQTGARSKDTSCQRQRLETRGAGSAGGAGRVEQQQAATSGAEEKLGRAGSGGGGPWGWRGEDAVSVAPFTWGLDWRAHFVSAERRWGYGLAPVWGARNGWVHFT